MQTSSNLDDRGLLFVKVTTSFVGLSTTAIILRFWSRAVGPRDHKIWWDDWTALIVWTSSTAQIITGVVWTHYGLGKHSETLTPSDALKGFKILWADYFLFGLCISSIKISALLFYTRVFNNVRRFKIVLRAALIVIALWFLAYLFIILFNCTPIHKFWDREVPGTCLDLYAWYMACVLIDTLLDLMVLLLPMPIIFNIHCKPSRKVAIFFAFFFGYLGMVPSLGRLITTAQAGKNIGNDFTYIGMPNTIISYIEGPIGTISICIPSWFHLFQRAKKHGMSWLFTTRDPPNSGAARTRPTADDNARGQGNLTNNGASAAGKKEERKYLGGRFAAALNSEERLLEAERGTVWIRRDVDVFGERMV